MYGSVQDRGGFRLVVIAASQGGLGTYLPMLSHLRGLDTPLVLLQHRARDDRHLPGILALRTGQRVEELADGDVPAAGALHLTPPGAITRITRAGTFSVEPLPPDVRCLRPADELLRSAALGYGSGVIAVILSGRLDDGAAGVREVKRHGGRVIAQDPGTAAQPSMPAAALATGCVDLCLDPARIAPALEAFVGVPGAADLFRIRPPAWVHA